MLSVTSRNALISMVFETLLSKCYCVNYIVVIRPRVVFRSKHERECATTGLKLAHFQVLSSFVNIR